VFVLAVSEGSSQQQHHRIHHSERTPRDESSVRESVPRKDGGLGRLEEGRRVDVNRHSRVSNLWGRASMGLSLWDSEESAPNGLSRYGASHQEKKSDSVGTGVILLSITSDVHRLDLFLVAKSCTATLRYRL